MKKVGFVMVISAFLLVGCGTKGNKAEESKAASSSETQTMTNSSSSAKQASSQTQSTTTNSQSVAKNTNTTQNETTSASTTINSTTETMVTPDPLSGYTNDQIEYARVWLAVMGTHYKTDLASGNFKLHVSHSAAGAAVNPYDSTSLTFPTETVTLSGEYGYQSLVVYSSNHNGTITCYPVPSHFQGDPRDQAAVKKQEQEILDQATIVSIPTGNPEDVKELIAVQVVDN